MVHFHLSFCPGVAWGTWKHAPIILLPRCIMLLNDAARSPCFDIQTPMCGSVLLVFSMASHLDNTDAFNALPLP